MTKTLPLSEAKAHLSRLVDDVVKKSDEIVITRNGRPVAVLMSTAEYDSWCETQAIKSNPELMKEIRKGLKTIRLGKTKRYESLDEVFGADQ